MVRKPNRSDSGEKGAAGLMARQRLLAVHHELTDSGWWGALLPVSVSFC